MLDSSDRTENRAGLLFVAHIYKGVVMAVDSPVLPGRLGSPGMTLRDDPRADPRMIAAMEPFALGDPPAEAPVDSESPIEALLEYVAVAEEGFEALFGALADGLPEIAGVTRSVEVIKGVDGNDVTLYVHRPVDDERHADQACFTSTAAGWCSWRPPGRRTPVT